MKLHAPAARAIREAREVPVAEIAAALGVTVGQVSNLLAGRRQASDNALFTLAGVLRVPVEAITIPEQVAA